MRIFSSLVLLVGGLCLLHALAGAKFNGYYHQQLWPFPIKDTYTQAELMDDTWQVWTNRVSLPQQGAYTVADLKAAIVRPVVGVSQGPFSRELFEYAIGSAVGYRKSPDIGLAEVGALAMLAGAFSLGASIARPKTKKTMPP